MHLPNPNCSSFAISSVAFNDMDNIKDNSNTTNKNNNDIEGESDGNDEDTTNNSNWQDVSTHGLYSMKLTPNVSTTSIFIILS